MSVGSFVALALCLVAASFAGTRAFAIRVTGTASMDEPNERSSHTTPVPRGAGIVFASLTLVGVTIWSVSGPPSEALPGTVIGALAATVLLGGLDDRLALSARLRLVAQSIIATTIVLSLSGAGRLSHGTGLESVHGFALGVLTVLGLVWLTNLYNFMDGIDTLAAGEGVFVCVLGAVACGYHGQLGIAAWLLLLGCGLIGFLTWNLPPARVFMGDAGSTFLGLFFGTVALASDARGGPEVWVWAILLGAFVVDATVTLVRRVAHGQRAVDAHRTHAYQYLSRRFVGHGRVSLGVLGINVCWLGPLALVATAHPASAPALTALAYAPLIVAVLGAGGGVPENRYPVE